MFSKFFNKFQMPLKSEQLQVISNNNIASYGFKEKVNRVKKAKKGFEETYRTNLRRQRDKILYTGGFRRMQDKTQVISATISGDHRTRLTHTLEVEQIAVSIANSLKLNSDLVSAISLGHDVGHTPFGHAAERKLNELLKHNGGFHHPVQSVRYIWEKYGKKINKEIYEGILLHDSDMYKIKKEDVKQQLKYLKFSNDGIEDFESWIEIDKWINNFPSTLEAQVVIWADKIAYITHDLEDFLRSSSYINLKKNNKEVDKKLFAILGKILDRDIKSIEEFELRDLIRTLISDLINTSYDNIAPLLGKKFKNPLELTVNRSSKFENNSEKKKYLNSLIINFSNKSKNIRDNYYELRSFLDEYYICSPEVQKSDAKAQVIVEHLFKMFNNNYKLMPLNLRNDIDEIFLQESDKNNNKLKTNKKCVDNKEGIVDAEKNARNRINQANDIIARKVACYIATMSDTYAENMYRDLIGSDIEFRI